MAEYLERQVILMSSLTLLWLAVQRSRSPAASNFSNSTKGICTVGVQRGCYGAVLPIREIVNGPASCLDYERFHSQ